MKAVAREHDVGRKLFIGTTNLDANVFTVWDMTAIAAGDRPDKLNRYRDVILASASFPVVFPPVYFTGELSGRAYKPIYVDGSMRKNTISSLYRIWIQALITGSEFNLAYIKQDFDLSKNAPNFDAAEMKAFYDILLTANTQ